MKLMNERIERMERHHRRIDFTSEYKARQQGYNGFIDEDIEKAPKPPSRLYGNHFMRNFRDTNLGLDKIVHHDGPDDCSGHRFYTTTLTQDDEEGDLEDYAWLYVNHAGQEVRGLSDEVRRKKAETKEKERQDVWSVRSLKRNVITRRVCVLAQNVVKRLSSRPKS